MAIPRYLSQYIPALQQNPDEEEQRRIMAGLAANTQPVSPDLDTPDKTAGPKYDPATQPVSTTTNMIGNESALIKRPPQPTQTLADYYSSNATPVDELTRARTTAPPAAAPAGPTVTYGDKGQPMGVEGGGDELAKQQAYLRALQTYKPENHNSRLKSAAITAGRSYLEGGLPGALVGFITGLIRPKVDEVYHNEGEIQRTGRAVAQEQQYRKQQSDLMGDAVDRDYKSAQTEKAMRGPSYAPIKIDTPDGPSLITDGVANPVYDPEGKRVKGIPKPSTTKSEVRHNPETGKAEKWELGQNGEPDKKVEGWSDPGKDMVKRNGMWVPQSTAYTGDALGGQRKFEQGRQTARDQRDEQWRAEDKGEKSQEKETAKQQKAAELAGKVDEGRRQTMELDQTIKMLKDKWAATKDPVEKANLEETINGYNYRRGEALANASRAAKELNQAFPELYEGGDGEGGYPYYKVRPFSVQQWRAKYPKASKKQEAAAVEGAKGRGQEVVDQQ